jgi:site-specific recombinase XerD
MAYGSGDRALQHLADDDFAAFTPPSQPEKLGETWRLKLEQELRARKYSLRTLRSYVYYNCLLCRTLQKTPEEIRPEDITQFLADVEKNRGYTASSINLAISAFKFFYGQVYKNRSISERQRPLEDNHLPQILSKEEISQILKMEKNPKHRLLLILAYSSGLRVSEVVALKREHIDISRKAIMVRKGKGRKDRCTLLSEKAAVYIEEYCAFYEIQNWLFPGQPPTSHLSIRSAQYIFSKAVRRAKIPKKVSIHNLRHTFATHLLEGGTDIRYIQELLGHSTTRTTERYTRVARRNILSIQSPLDTII